jgi:hypothetical protein
MIADSLIRPVRKEEPGMPGRAVIFEAIQSCRLALYPTAGRLTLADHGWRGSFDI